MSTTSKKIAVIDYSIGNLFSVIQACKYVELDPYLTSDPADLKNADAVILPGVGAFAKGMDNLRSKGLDSALHDFVKTGKPFLGVCLGMQLLCEQSEEFEVSQGLGILKGSVQNFRRVVPENTPVPQVMWNEIQVGDQPWEGTPLEGANPNSHFYFVHSFYCQFTDKISLSRTRYYGFEYASSVLKDNVFATQFHPEKSGREGIAIYRKWKELFLDK
jgi:glutamine amidotransferase